MHPAASCKTDTIHFVDWYTKEKFYLYTVIDLHTRMAYAAVHGRLSQRWSYQTLLEASMVFGVTFATIQADNGPEFSRWLGDMLSVKGVALRHSPVSANPTTTPTLSALTGRSNRNCWAQSRSKRT
jgi:hypothetical protein